MKVNSGQAASTLIPEYIGSAFDKIVTVADNIKHIKGIAASIEGLVGSGYIGDTPPTEPMAGATWYCTLDGRSYIWYEDADSGQWVESSPQSTAEAVQSVEDDPYLAGNIFTLWKRSAAEAGYNLVAGSFEEGGVLTSSTDVLWHKELNSIYSWVGAYPINGYTVLPHTSPIGNASYVRRTDVVLRDQLSSSGGGELLFADKLFKPNSVYASTFLGIPAICATSVWEYANLVTSKPNANDPTTWDWTPAIQAAIDNTPQGGWVSFPDINGWYEFTSIRLKAGVNLTANGKSLYGGTIYFRDAVSQVVSNTLFGMWMKRVFISYTKEVGDTGLACNNVRLSYCHIDGTAKNNGGTVNGDAITMSGPTFDLHLDHTYIWNYSGRGLLVSATDAGSTPPYLATGVFTTLNVVKIFNCGYGIDIVGSAADTADVNLNCVLLDHCGIGLKTSKPAGSGNNELFVFGNSVRIELCSVKAIENSGAYISIDRLWAFGGASGADSKYIHNIVGKLDIGSGRVSCNIYNEPGNVCVVDAEMGGGSYTGVTRRVTSNTGGTDSSEMKVLRFKIDRGTTPGTDIKVTLLTTEGSSFGGSDLSNAQSANIQPNTTATVGSGASQITYGLTGGGILTITLPYRINATFSPLLVKNDSGLSFNISARRVGAAGGNGSYIVVEPFLLSGVPMYIPDLGSTASKGTYMIFEIGISCRKS